MLIIKTELVILNEEYIKDKIYIIRGKKVMIDSDLAEIYDYTTKAFNQQVKNNIDRFDLDFRFELTLEEYNYILRSKKLTSSLDNNYGGRRYLPYAFTEEGIYMLMTVLKGEKAIKQSKTLIRIFKSMKDYLVDNKLLEQNYINNMVLNHENKIKFINENIKLIQESFNKLEEKRKINSIYFNGQIYDAYSKILNIFKSAKDKLIIVDNYADNELLDIIKELNINVTLTTTNKYIKQSILDKYNNQYNNLNVVYDNTFHDRYFVVDNYIYHCGTSINRIGYKTFSITLINDNDVIKVLINKINNIICK